MAALLPNGYVRLQAWTNGQITDHGDTDHAGGMAATRHQLSAARSWALPPSMFARRRGSGSSAGAKRGEIMAGVHAEGNVPLSVCTPGYSSAYHYPLKDGTNYTNMADHNWEAVRRCRYLESNQQWLLDISPRSHRCTEKQSFKASSQRRKLNQKVNSSRHQLS